MGWKNVKDHYGIVHQVQVTEQGICIGSPYIQDLVVIDAAGVVVKRDARPVNENMQRYLREMDANPKLLAQLVATSDAFERSIKVYTYKGADILEKQCEDLGWPNVTHDGELMYENTFSADRATVEAWALRDAELHVRHRSDAVDRARAELQRQEAELAHAEAVLHQLKIAGAEQA